MKKSNMLFGYTRAAISLIKKELSIIALILSVITQIIFLAFTIYLIVINAGNIGYVIAYSCLGGCSIILFILSIIFKIRENDSKETIRKKKKKYRTFKFIVKAIKYLLKIAIIVIALYDISVNGSTFIAELSTLVSSALIIIQITVDFVIYLINRYIDYLRLSISIDTKNKNTHLLANTAEVIANKIQDASEYSEEEQMMIDELGDEKEEIYTVQKEKRVKKFKENIKIIKNGIKEKLKIKNRVNDDEQNN